MRIVGEHTIDHHLVLNVLPIVKIVLIYLYCIYCIKFVQRILGKDMYLFPNYLFVLQNV